MPLYFRKSIKIAPGLKVNITKTGTSLSAGKKGASVNISNKGVKTSVGIPGSGLSYRTNNSFKSNNKESKGCLGIILLIIATCYLISLL